MRQARSRVSFFRNRFRRFGFINYDSDSLHVHSSLLNVLLHEEDEINAIRGNENSTSCSQNDSEAPPEPGGPADKDRAKRPRLLGLERRSG